MPSQPETFALAVAHQQGGRLPEAEAIYRRILADDPRHAHALYMLGVLAHQGRRADLAVEYLQSAIAIEPAEAMFHNELGNLLQGLRRFDEAIASFERARQLQPQTPQVHFNLGNALRAAGQNQAAEASYRQAIALAPDFAPAYNNLGTLRQSLGDLTDAEHCYRQAVQFDPGYAEAHYNLGAVLQKRDDADGAQAAYRRAIELCPDFAQAHYNLGKLLQAGRRRSEARQCFCEALRVCPQYAEVHCSLGELCLALGEYGAARTHLTTSLEFQPDMAEGHYNLGMLLLVHGDFAAGWPEYTWHVPGAQFEKCRFEQPAWDGSPLEGRTILIHCDHGLGDTLQFVRYLDEVRRRGAGRILLAAQRVLDPLLAASGIGELLPANESFPRCDAHATLTSLPGIFRDSLETIPARVPYLRAARERVEHWREPLSRYEGIRVGIGWQGNREFAWDDLRSIPLDRFEPLAQVPGVCLISLQRGDGSEQLRELDGRFDVVELGDDVDRGSGAFMDTAAIIEHLHLVITSDSALAHLAGAMGANVWVALPHAPDWRWLLDRLDSPWYPTMRLFRQRTLGDWSDPFAQMAEQLSLLARGGSD